jgi:hypothetical protein
MAWDRCDKCGKRTSDKAMWTLKVCGASMDSPAEYERLCLRPSCAPRNRERDDELRSLRGYTDEEKARI